MDWMFPEARAARTRDLLSQQLRTDPNAGVFDNFASGAGSYFMRGMAETARNVSMAGAVLPIVADKLVGGDNQSSESLADKYFRSHDEVFQSAVDYWTPKAGTVGKAGEITGQLAAGLVKFIASPALAVADAQLSTATELTRAGVDTGAALIAGDLAGLSTVAGVAAPFVGRSLALKMASGVAGNIVPNTLQAAATAGVLTAAGAPEQARGFDWSDPTARGLDILMGAAFGGAAHYMTKTGQRKFTLTDEQRNALLVANQARHLERAAGLTATTAESTAHVAAMRQSVDQLLRGEPVTAEPPRIDREVNFRAWFGDSKVTDADGRPLVLYHGTGRDVRSFDAKRQGDTFAQDDLNVPSDGFWFASDPARSEWYAGVSARRSKDGAANLMPVYLKMDNPFIYSAEDFANEGISGLPSLYEIERRGHDGVIVERGEYGEGDKFFDVQPVTQRDYAVFRPEQIKSAIGNSGRFDPNSASLTDYHPPPHIAAETAEIQAELVKNAPEMMAPIERPEMAYQIDHKPMSRDGGASTLDDLTTSFGEDVYGKDALNLFGSGDKREGLTLKVLRNLRGKPDALVTIYRGVPEGVDKINPGDWVTLSKAVAEDYGNVISMKVPASHVTGWADSLLEFGYYPPDSGVKAPDSAAQAPRADVPDIQVPTGEVHPDGSDVYIPARDLIAKAEADAEASKTTGVDLYRAAANCLLGSL